MRSPRWRDWTGAAIVYYDPDASWGAARMHAFQRARASGVELRRYPVSADDLRDAGLLLDGLLGVNARLPLDAVTAVRVAAMNAAGVPILALDVADGLRPDDRRTGRRARARDRDGRARPAQARFVSRSRPRCDRRPVVRATRHARRRRRRHRSRRVGTDRRRVRRVTSETPGRVGETQRRRAADRRRLRTISGRGDFVRPRRRAFGRRATSPLRRRKRPPPRCART